VVVWENYNKLENIYSRWFINYWNEM